MEEHTCIERRLHAYSLDCSNIVCQFASLYSANASKILTSAVHADYGAHVMFSFAVGYFVCCSLLTAYSFFRV
jgi:hypothetical protein